jgi:hypothetical protein
VSVALRRKLKIGTIVVVQTHGRSGEYNPHLHIIMTSGGISGQREVGLIYGISNMKLSIRSGNTIF